MSAQLFSKFLFSQKKIIMPSGKLSQSFLWALLGSYNFFIHPFLVLLFFVGNLYFFPLVFNPSSQEPLQTALNLTYNTTERWQLYQRIQKPNSPKWQFCKWNQLLPKHDQKQVLKRTQTEIYFWSPTYFEGLLLCHKHRAATPVPALGHPHVHGVLQASPTGF